MLVPMQPPPRGPASPQRRVITAWIVWFALTAAAGVYYLLGWVIPHQPSGGGESPPAAIFLAAATVAGAASLALGLRRRGRVPEPGRKFVLLILGGALAEMVALLGFVLKYIFNAAPDLALKLWIAGLALHLLNIPTDFKPPEAAPPGFGGDFNPPPPIG